jgi:uncharacterized membrane protein
MPCVSGTMAKLVGADLIYSNRITSFMTSVEAIRGVSTFDGIFQNGIFATYVAFTHSGICSSV